MPASKSARSNGLAAGSDYALALATDKGAAGYRVPSLEAAGDLVARSATDAALTSGHVWVLEGAQGSTNGPAVGLYRKGTSALYVAVRMRGSTSPRRGSESA